MLQNLTPGPVVSWLEHVVIAHLTLDPSVRLNRCQSASAFVNTSFYTYHENSDPPEVKLESIAELLVEGAGRGIGVVNTAPALGTGAVLMFPLREFDHMLVLSFPLWLAPLPLNWRLFLDPDCWLYW